jgi:hypothetical protein
VVSPDYYFATKQAGAGRFQTFKGQEATRKTLVGEVEMVALQYMHRRFRLHSPYGRQISKSELFYILSDD